MRAFSIRTSGAARRIPAMRSIAAPARAAVAGARRRAAEPVRSSGRHRERLRADRRWRDDRCCAHRPARCDAGHDRLVVRLAQRRIAGALQALASAGACPFRAGCRRLRREATAARATSGATSIVDEYIGSALIRRPSGFVAPAGIAGLYRPEPRRCRSRRPSCARERARRFPIDVGYLVHHVRRTTAAARCVRASGWRALCGRPE